MIEKVEERIYKIEVPLPNNPLKNLNSYVLTGKNPLIIDTGFNMEACYRTLIESLKILKIEPRKADVLATHLHADHLGLAKKVARKLLISEVDVKIAVQFILNPNYWERIIEVYIKNGFPESEARRIVEIHPAKKYISGIPEATLLKDGDTLEYRDRNLQVILTPGHTPGHICLYDEDGKILFSGDHVLFDITPNITFWESVKDSIIDYLKSLEKVYDLEVEKLFQGIGSLEILKKELKN